MALATRYASPQPMASAGMCIIDGLLRVDCLPQRLPSIYLLRLCLYLQGARSVLCALMEQVTTLRCPIRHDLPFPWMLSSARWWEPRHAAVQP
eukprot:350468-Chlamydomonas_euryale.AAC.6